MIKNGDLVMVVKPTPCCGIDGSIGRLFRVSDLIKSNYPCPICGRSENQILATEYGFYGGFAICRLKKIDPPALPEEVVRDEMVEA